MFTLEIKVTLFNSMIFARCTCNVQADFFMDKEE